MNDVTATDLWDLVLAYGVVLGVVVLSTGWQLLRTRRPAQSRREVVVPPVGVIERDTEGAP